MRTGRPLKLMNHLPQDPVLAGRNTLLLHILDQPETLNPAFVLWFIHEIKTHL